MGGVVKDDVIIVGGGPAGSAAGILLARRGYEVVLLEKQRFPRDKLCGEFLAPEGRSILEKLGVLSKVLAAGAQTVTRAAFVSPDGEELEVSWAQVLGANDSALGISRAVLDHVLLEEARAAGVTVIEGFCATAPLVEDGRVAGVKGRWGATEEEAAFSSRLTIDASGRKGVLVQHVSPAETKKANGPRRFGFKAHFSNVHGLEDRIELYFYPSGYGGLINIENGMANLCFITSQDIARTGAGSAEKLLEQTLFENPLARRRLSPAKVEHKWIGVGPLSFGRRSRAYPGLLALGDAAAEIDPFLGEGMLIALQTAELSVEAIDQAMKHQTPEAAAASIYSSLYQKRFVRRFQLCSALRWAAFSPIWGNRLIALLSKHRKLAEAVARITRR
jgi:flavin-dependent dehydrogenase